MFTVLQTMPRESGLIARISDRIAPKKIQKEYVSVKGGTPFLICRIKEEKHGIDWQKLSISLSGKEKTILKDNGISLPCSFGLDEFDGKKLPTTMMLNNFAEIMKAVGTPSKIKISIFDCDGFLAEKIEDIIMLVSQITVYTNEIRKYFFSAQKIMEKYGASVRIYEYDSEKKAEKVILADKYDYLRMGEASSVFCASADIVYDNVILGSGIALDEEYLSLKPQHTDTISFACALYECCNVKSLSTQKYSRLSLFGKEISTDEAVKRIKEIKGF